MPLPIPMTPYSLARQFLGMRELSAPGKDHGWIRWALSLVGMGPEAPDETPWCSAFVAAIAWHFPGVPRSRSAAARSWLDVGKPVGLSVASPGFDVVVLSRGRLPQPGADVMYGPGRYPPGHVGFFDGIQGSSVLVLGGNQGNAVTVDSFPMERVLGFRRLE